MKYDFDKKWDRHGHDATKWDNLIFPTPVKDIVPMWVADMDFASPDCVVRAMAKRLEHPMFGYFKLPAEYYEGIASWQKKRYGVDGVKPENIDYHNGVLGGVSSFVEAFTLPGDYILINDTCYTGFQGTVKNRGRYLLYSPLVEDANGFHMDFDDMEKKIIEFKPPIMIFCNPHNPTGHVWTHEEMVKTVELCDKYDMKIISDEIWADFMVGGKPHVPTHTCCDRAKDIVYSMYAPSKTFNLAGLQGSYSICWNQAMRDRVNKAGVASHYNAANVLSVHAAIGAYTGDEGAEYVDQLCTYVRANQEYCKKYLDDNFKGVKSHLPDGTYLLWLDCSECGLDIQEVLDRMVAVGVIPNDGRTFHGSAHIRLNLACPRANCEEAMKRFHKVFLPK